jgi:cell division protein FtsL
MATLDRLVPPTAQAPVASTWSPRRAITVVLLIATFIALVQVFQSSSFAQSGQTLQRLEQQKQDLRADIHSLEAEVAALSSLDRTERAARERLGMVPARNLSYLSVNVSPPKAVLLPRPLLTPKTEEPAQRQSWWQSFAQALPLP